MINKQNIDDNNHINNNYYLKLFYFVGTVTLHFKIIEVQTCRACKGSQNQAFCHRHKQKVWGTVSLFVLSGFSYGAGAVDNAAYLVNI